MNNNNPPPARKLARFFSEQYQNYGYMEEESENGAKPPIVVSPPRISRKNFLRQISIQAEQKIDDSEREAELVSEILQQPAFTRLTSITQDEEITDRTNIIVESITPHVAIETGITYTELKTGSQRFRWNLLFNILVWLIVPLPFWIPFASNKVALYLLPSIQGVFVFIWISKKFFLSLINILFFLLSSYRFLGIEKCHSIIY
jgi:hypothetical protein